MGKIYFRTIAYNAEKTLARCVESVLGQTRYGEDIVYYICDNGSTDRTGEMIREYAAKDPRVRPFFNRKNRVWEPQNEEIRSLWTTLREEDFLCFLDADDAYEPEFLARLMPFLRENRLDIAVCRSKLLNGSVGRLEYLRTQSLQEPILLTCPEDFTAAFPAYHQFMRTMWGKIFSGKTARHIYTNETRPAAWKGSNYGSDTLMAFSALRFAERVGIFPDILHRYYVSFNSVSFQYDEHRFDSDAYLYEDALEFLSAYGKVSGQNRWFLARVYANAVRDTVRVLDDSERSPEEELRELHRIAVHPVTGEAFRWEHEDITRSRRTILLAALDCGGALPKETADFQAVLEALAPHCAPAVTPKTGGLLLREPALLDAVVADDRRAFLRELLQINSQRHFVRQYDLGGMVRALAADRPLLREIDDGRFLRRYPDVYLDVWDGRYRAALERMKELLDTGEGKGETFLRLCSALSEAV